MAWLTGSGKHQYRKEASAHKRAADNRAAVEPRERAPSSKRIPNHARKFGIEIKMKAGVWRSHFYRDDWRNWNWYETEKRRDAALSAITRKSDIYEYRKSQR